MPFLRILGYFTHFLAAVTPLIVKKIEFYKCDLIIRFPVLINLPIQYLKHLTSFLATLCHFNKFWSILLLILGVCDVTNDPKILKPYSPDLIIRCFVQINLPISNLK